MLTYKKISENNGVKRYEYYPSGNTEKPGVVEYDKNGNASLIKVSEADVKMYFALHALNGIDTTKNDGTVAWH